ncbi:MAG: class I SAM-dependent methyltransferase [Anaerolineales bacterium]
MAWWRPRRLVQPIELESLDAYARWAAAYSPEVHNPLMALEEQAMLGLDNSPAMLARAAALGQPLARADLLNLPLAAGGWDVVVCGLAVGHVAALASVLGEMGRVLAPGGSVVYSDLHPFGALAGWKRSFRGQDGREYAARHHIHLYADHQAACQAAGLTITAVREPRIEFDHPYRGYPAVLVIRASKP